MNFICGESVYQQANQQFDFNRNGVSVQEGHMTQQFTKEQTYLEIQKAEKLKKRQKKYIIKDQLEKCDDIYPFYKYDKNYQQQGISDFVLEDQLDMTQNQFRITGLMSIQELLESLYSNKTPKSINFYVCNFILTRCKFRSKNYEEFVSHMLKHSLGKNLNLCKEIYKEVYKGSEEQCVQFIHDQSYLEVHLTSDHNANSSVLLDFKNAFTKLQKKNQQKIKNLSNQEKIDKIKNWLRDLMNQFNNENDMKYINYQIIKRQNDFEKYCQKSKELKQCNNNYLKSEIQDSSVYQISQMSSFIIKNEYFQQNIFESQIDSQQQILPENMIQSQIVEKNNCDIKSAQENELQSIVHLVQDFKQFQEEKNKMIEKFQENILKIFLNCQDMFNMTQNKNEQMQYFLNRLKFYQQEYPEEDLKLDFDQFTKFFEQ